MTHRNSADRLFPYAPATLMSPSLPTGSVTGQLQRAQQGDQQSFEWLWRRYHSMLVRYLQRKNRGAYFQPVDPNDVAHSAFVALHQGFINHKFHSLLGRIQLWKLLTVIGMRKAQNRAKSAAVYQRYISRYAALRNLTPDYETQATSVSPETAAALETSGIDAELEHRLHLLDQEDPKQRLRELVMHKLNGRSNAYIADEFGCTRKTVALRLNLIYEIWKAAAEE
jgi:DNA-directed RNA polymerase specialized sigma24 family protein